MDSEQDNQDLDNVDVFCQSEEEISKNKEYQNGYAQQNENKQKIKNQISQKNDNIVGDMVNVAEQQNKKNFDKAKIIPENLSDDKIELEEIKGLSTSFKKGPQDYLQAAQQEISERNYFEAREILDSALEQFPDSVDLWLEAIRIEKPKNVKYLLEKAIQYIPDNIDIWLLGIENIPDPEIDVKKRMTEEALKHVPNQVHIWYKLMDLAGNDQDQIKNILYRAVEQIPKSLEFWMALIKLESYENAKQLLTKAKQSLPKNPKILFLEAKIEEGQISQKSNDIDINNQISTILTQGLQYLQQNDYM